MTSDVSASAPENEAGPETSAAAPSFGADFRTAGCGFLMGAADIVPGVSGGTVALILGIYERLVSAISQCNSDFIKLVLAREWKAAADHIDLRFLLALGGGIACGIGGLASVMNHLLTNHMSLTFAAFTGMILASSVLVAKRVSSWRIEVIGMLILGVNVALRLVTLQALQNPPDTLWYMFLCGMIGITAMILPGISGAFILLLLSRYHYITDSIKGILHGDINVTVLVSLAVFALGCLTGLLSFSRILRWQLKHYHDATMAILCGFMLGSLYRLWPFQQEVGFAEKFKLKVFEHVVPDGFTTHVGAVLVLCGLGFVTVLVLDVIANRGKKGDV